MAIFSNELYTIDHKLLIFIVFFISEIIFANANNEDNKFLNPYLFNTENLNEIYSYSGNKNNDENVINNENFIFTKKEYIHEETLHEYLKVFKRILQATAAPQNAPASPPAQPQNNNQATAAPKPTTSQGTAQPQTQNNNPSQTAGNTQNNQPATNTNTQAQGAAVNPNNGSTTVQNKPATTNAANPNNGSTTAQNKPVTTSSTTSSTANPSNVSNANQNKPTTTSNSANPTNPSTATQNKPGTATAPTATTSGNNQNPGTTGNASNSANNNANQNKPATTSGNSNGQGSQATPTAPAAQVLTTNISSFTTILNTLNSSNTKSGVTTATTKNPSNAKPVGTATTNNPSNANPVGTVPNNNQNNANPNNVNNVNPGNTATTPNQNNADPANPNNPNQASNTNTSNSNINSNTITSTLAAVAKQYNQQVQNGQAAASNTLFDLASTTIGIVKNLNQQQNQNIQPPQGSQAGQTPSQTQPNQSNNQQPANNTNNQPAQQPQQQPTQNPQNPQPTSAIPIAEVQQIKSTVIDTADTLVQSNTISTNLNYRTDYFTVQIYNNSTQAQNDDYAVENNLPLLDFTACENKIREYYNFPANISIPVGKINWDPTLTNSDNIGDISYVFYNPYTGEKINSAAICKEVGVQVKIPTNTTQINTTLYEIYKNQSINILDTSSDFYNSRCVPFSNSTSDADVTLNDRRSLIYPNVSITCSIGCTFSGLDANNYTICDCYDTNETQAMLQNAILSGLSESNIDIFVCFSTAFDFTISNNPGFYCNGSFLIIAVVTSIIFQNTIYSNLLTKFLVQIIKNDASHFALKGQMIDSNTVKGGEKLDLYLQNNDIDTKKIDMAKIGSCPPIDPNLLAEVNSINKVNIQSHQRTNSEAEQIAYNKKENNASEPGKYINYDTIDNKNNILILSADERIVENDEMWAVNNERVGTDKNYENNRKNSLKYYNNSAIGEAYAHNIDKVYSYSKDFTKKNLFNINDSLAMISNEIESDERKGGFNLHKKDPVYKISQTVANYPPPGPKKEQMALNPYFREESQKLEINDEDKEAAFSPIEDLKDHNTIGKGEIKLKMKDSNDDKNEKHTNKNNIQETTIKSITPEQFSHMITLKDYDQMPVGDLPAYDKRGFFKFYWDCILTRQDFLKAFIYKTGLSPFYMRIILFFLALSIAFALNAIFYSDSFIAEKNKVVLTTKMNTFLFTLQKQLSKSIWSVIIGVIPIILLDILMIVPKSIYNEYNLMILNKDTKEIDHSFIVRKMRIRYIIVIFFSLVFHLIAWYYVIVFCSVYTKSSVSWVCGGIISIIIKMLIIQPIIPLFLALFRAIYFKYPKTKFWMKLYGLLRKIM